MKSNTFWVFLLFTLFASLGHAQTITISTDRPNPNEIVHEGIYIQVEISSTYEIQNVQANVENRSVPLAVALANIWTNTIPTTGLSYGGKTLTIIATDVFGNSNQVQRTISYDLPPTMSVNSPSFGFVVRTNLPVDVVGMDDSPTNPTVQLWNFVPDTVIVQSSGSLKTNMVLASPQVLDYFFLTKDTAGQTVHTHRLIYVEMSSNLVEVARVSDGEIQDAQPDRILFTSIDNHGGLIGNYDSSTDFRLMFKSRLDGTETLVNEEIGTNFVGEFLTPQGVLFVLPDGFRQWQNGTLLSYVPLYPSSLPLVRGSFAACNGNYAHLLGLYLCDLVSTNVYVITNSASLMSLDLAADGDVVFIPPPSLDSTHPVFRFRNGVNTLLASDPVNTNSNPKTDGNNICYIKTTSTNQILMLITNGVETPIASGLAIGSDLQINNGWIAYSRNSGSGTMQVWRRSPEGANTQLTFFGSSSTVTALAANGEIAIFNGLELYISKGTWPPVDIVSSPTILSNFLIPALKPFWQVDRWYATLGGSLFQIHTGLPQIQRVNLTNGVMQLDIMAAAGQHVVTQTSSNLADWVDLATNNIADESVLQVVDPATNTSAKFYRLKAQ